ncbi:MAG: glycosyltransferase [Verrucomicrobia bacterium]|nr:glycosyltransferase [Verrucomicrobiota bacterium]
MPESQTHYDSVAAMRKTYIRKNRYYYDDLLRLLRHVVAPDASVIELGCGIGHLVGALPNSTKAGIDFSETMLDIARSESGEEVDYMSGDIEDLQHEATYDYVLMLDLVNSLRDVQNTLTDIRHKLCADHSRLVITYYNALWEPVIRLADLLKLRMQTPNLSWLSRSDVATLLELSGFEIVTSGERLLWPRFVPGLSWLLNAVLAKLPLLRRLCLVHYVIARPGPQTRREYSVSILIPARNEAGNVERALQTIPRFGSSQEILFVEGNSTDDTWDVIQTMAEQYKERCEIQVMQQPGKGKGDAVRTGFAAATKEVLMILDGDLTVDPSDLPKFYEALATGKAEFINGSRLVYPMEKEAMQMLNMLANKCFGILFTWLLGQPLKDTLCGTKVLRRSDYDRIAANRSYFGDFDPFGDFDLLFGAAKQNLKIIDVPVRYRDRSYGSTNISRWSHGWLLLKMCAFAARKLKFR